MFSKTQIALSDAMVLSIAFPASAATKHHRVTHVHQAIYDTARSTSNSPCRAIPFLLTFHALLKIGPLKPAHS
jgi:hypothetical protein